MRNASKATHARLDRSDDLDERERNQIEPDEDDDMGDDDLDDDAPDDLEARLHDLPQESLGGESEHSIRSAGGGILDLGVAADMGGLRWGQAVTVESEELGVEAEDLGVSFLEDATQSGSGRQAQLSDEGDRMHIAGEDDEVAELDFGHPPDRSVKAWEEVPVIDGENADLIDMEVEEAPWPAQADED